MRTYFTISPLYLLLVHIYIYIYRERESGEKARGVMVIGGRNGHGDTGSNPGRG